MYNPTVPGYRLKAVDGEAWLHQAPAGHKRLTCSLVLADLMARSAGKKRVKPARFDLPEVPVAEALLLLQLGCVPCHSLPSTDSLPAAGDVHTFSCLQGEGQGRGQPAFRAAIA